MPDEEDAPGLPDDFDEYLKLLEGKNPFNEISREVWFGNEKKADVKKRINKLIDRFTSDCPIGPKGKRGIMYLGLLARFEKFCYTKHKAQDHKDKMGLLGPDSTNYRLLVGPEENDGGFDAFVIDRFARKIYPVESKSGTSSGISYDKPIKKLLDRSKEVLIDRDFTLKGVKNAWKVKIKKMAKYVKKGYEVEPVFIANSFTAKAIDKIEPDDYSDLVLEEIRDNFIAKLDFIDKSQDIRRKEDYSGMPPIKLRFPLDFIKKPTTIRINTTSIAKKVPVNVLMGLVPLIDLVTHYGEDESVKPLLFARNVRFPQRDPAFKETLDESLRDGPDEFFVLNNGISATAIGLPPDNLGTMTETKLKTVLKEMEKKGPLPKAGTKARHKLVEDLNKERLNVFNQFLVINGAQTISTAEELTNIEYTDPKVKLTDKCLVPIRITILDRKHRDKERKVITKISIANNRQRKIQNSDLFTNHRIHISLKEKLEEFKIYYETKSKEYEETTKLTAGFDNKKYWFKESEIKVIERMENNTLGIEDPYIKKTQTNIVNLDKFTKYLLAFIGKPIDARINIQSQYKDEKSHQKLWGHYENSTKRKGNVDQKIGPEEFYHKLLCFCAGAYLQNSVMKGLQHEVNKPKLKKEVRKKNLPVSGTKAELIHLLNETGGELRFDKDLRKQLVKIYGAGYTDLKSKALLKHAKWYFLHVFRKRFKKEIDKLIPELAVAGSPRATVVKKIDAFFDKSRKATFVKSLPTKLIKTMKDVKVKVNRGDSGYEKVRIEKHEYFFQSPKCLEEFEKTVDV